MELLAQQMANGIVLGSIYGLLAICLVLIFGVLDIPQFALGAMAMLGGYVVFLLGPIVGYWVSLLAAMVAIGALGAVVQRLVFAPLRKAADVTVFVAAFGLVLIFQGLALVIFGPDPRQVPPSISGSLVIGGVHIAYHRLVIVGVVLAVFLALQWVLRSTRAGRVIRAVGQSTTGAQVVGIPTGRVAFAVMILGSALAGLAGGLLAPISQAMPLAGDSLTINAFIVIILAGMGSIGGALVAAYIVGLVESLGATYLSQDFSQLYSILLMLIVLLVKPSGLFGKKVSRV